MKEFEGKTLQEALEKASNELNKKVEEIKYTVVSEVKSLFKKSVKISVLELSDADQVAKDYLQGILNALGLQANIEIVHQDDIMHVNMTSESDAPKIIGRGGETLKALNELVRSAVFNKFDQHIRVLVNINNYKDQKYDKLVSLAQRVAATVKRTRVTAELDPMPSDERRVIHNALADDTHIKTLSVGVGKNRHVTIQYVNFVPNTEKTEDSETKESVEETDK